MTTTFDYESAELVKLNFDFANKINLDVWQIIDRDVTNFLGHYDAHTSTVMRALIHTIASDPLADSTPACRTAVFHVATHIEDRLSAAGAFILNRRMFVIDRDEWHPQLIMACELFVAESVERFGFAAFGTKWCFNNGSSTSPNPKSLASPLRRSTQPRWASLPAAPHWTVR